MALDKWLINTFEHITAYNLYGPYLKLCLSLYFYYIIFIMIKKTLLILLVLSNSIIGLCQSTLDNEEFEVYKQDKNNKILIIPFENKMYASSIDAEIADKNQINYYDIKDEFKKGIAEQILLSISNKIPAVSLIHHQDTSADIINHIQQHSFK